MPDISTTGTKDQTDTGFGFLSNSNPERTLLFAGTTLPTSLTVTYDDDTGTPQVLHTVTSLPDYIRIGEMRLPIKIVSTGGSPDFNVTSGNP